jgi:ketosteroid isomerase-like protein
VYRTIVTRKTRRVFDALNSGDTGPLLAGLDTPTEHVMWGDHALSGVRSNSESIERWYQRLFRLLPDLRFDIDTIAVKGPPWRTTVFVEWRDSALAGTYGNRGINVVELRYGRVRAIRIHCDTQHLARAVGELALQGKEEAAAAPIVDPAPVAR